uniref:Si:ch211-216p19.6 n=1 Tax=Kryptolebias marmoratus TaxID=37003 RepID=A0A3Q3B0V3_KRYMA
MSATSCVLSEEQFLCCICLDVFIDPVTKPCGHNFFKNCITQHWNINSARYQCPICKKHFMNRDRMSEIKVSQVGEIPCDVCSGIKLKAVKSCLTCFASYCCIHLDPHQTCDRLKTHMLTDPVDNMEGRVCKKHNRALELFCRSDQMCVCAHCTITEHGQWDTTLSLCMMNTKQNSLSCKDAEKEIRIEDEVDSYTRQLEEEISILMKRAAELKKLSCTQDHFHLIQDFPCRNSAMDLKTELGFQLLSFEGTAVRAVSELEEVLSKEKMQLRHGARLRRVQDYAVDVILDPGSYAGPVWGADGGPPRQHREIFSLHQRLSPADFSSGRFYYEVQVAGKTDWTVGVIKESVDRKGMLPLSPVNGYWAVGLRNENEYLTYLSPAVKFSMNSSLERVGVFVSYEEGLVSFYDADKAVHLYSFSDYCFMEKLYPFFSPGLHHGGKKCCSSHHSIPSAEHS